MHLLQLVDHSTPCPLPGAAPTRTLRDLPPFEPITDHTLFEIFSSPAEMLVPHFVERGTLTMLSGSWGSGKTATLMSLGIAVANGLEFAERFQTRQGRVLFAGFEANGKAYRKQLGKLLAGLELATSRMDIILPGGQDLSKGAPWQLLLSLVEREGYELLLIDGLKALSSADENSNTEMDPVMARLLTLTDLGATVVFTHHTSKPTRGEAPSKNDSRGASVIPARCDAEWRVAHDPKTRALDLTCMKSRGEFEVGLVHGLRMDYDDTSITISPAESANALASALRNAIQDAQNGLQMAELLDVAKAASPEVPEGARKQRVKRALKALGPSIKHGGQGKPYFWVGEGVKGSHL